MHRPLLQRVTRESITWHTDPVLLERHGIVIAFTERTGGVSSPPYASLDLAGHVGDEPDAVDANRTRLLSALDLPHARRRLTCSEQVHGERIAEVAGADAGAGARVAGGFPAIPSADALVTVLPDTPLLLCFADCVPVVLVATGPVPAVAVVHAGWRGALARLPGKAAAVLAQRAGCEPSELLAYVGAHVCADCYAVGDEVLSQFAEAFASIGAAQDRRLDLGAVVSESLREAGVPDERQARLGICTAESTDRFFSYRAERVTGRHGAVAAVLQGRG